MNYKEAGVDIEAGYEAVNRMKQHVARTHIPGVMGTVGGFGGFFDLSALGYQAPVLVSGTDGVGTKLMLAFELDDHRTIGMDAVAMCVNDIITSGAKPLYFLDYIATAKLDPAQVEDIVAGVAEGCVQAGCALIGGETAEMPGLYTGKDYDLAGFCVGAVEKAAIITGEHLSAGDVLLGLPSSGVHSNGYSLVRKIIKDKGLDLSKTYEGFDKPLGQVLLTPTRIYVRQIQALLEQVHIKAMSHITGGGFVENIPRMLTEGFEAHVSFTWERPPIFDFLQSQGDISPTEMNKVFNQGIGMVVAISAEEVAKAQQLLQDLGETSYIIGTVQPGNTGIQFVGQGPNHAS